MRNTAALLLLSLTGCGAPGGGPSASADLSSEGGGGDMALVGGAQDDAGTRGPCGDQKFPDGGVCLTRVTGKVVDEKGNGLAKAQVTVCGPVCYYGTIAGDGSFLVKIGQHVVPSRWAAQVHGRPDRVSYFIPLPPFVDDAVDFARPFIVPALPGSGPSMVLEKSMKDQSLVSGDVMVTLVAGTTVSLDVEDVALGDLGKQLRAVTIADPKTLPFVDAKDPPLGLYGFAPFESSYAPLAQVSFNNGYMLPANAPVDVYGEAGLYDSQPAGSFNKVATAHVSPDGKRIAMDPGQGVATLRWLALRKGK